MLIVALVMAAIGLAALVTAVVTSNELIAWVCIVASLIGVVLLIVDALRERRRRSAEPDDDQDEDAASEDVAAGGDTTVDDLEAQTEVADYPDEIDPEETDEAAESDKANDGP